jgi:hypothetical protein
MSSRLFILSCLSALLYAPASWGSQENGAVNIGGSIVPLPVAHVYVTSTATNRNSSHSIGPHQQSIRIRLDSMAD